jgi:hypothetical protein
LNGYAEYPGNTIDYAPRETQQKNDGNEKHGCLAKEVAELIP